MSTVFSVLPGKCAIQTALAIVSDQTARALQAYMCHCHSHMQTVFC